MKIIKLNTSLLLILSAISILLTNLGKYLLNIDDIMYRDYSSQLSVKQVEKIFYYQKKLELINYFLEPLVILFKTIVISSVLYIGSFFFSKGKTYFKKIIRIVIKAEFIFLLIPFFKLIWFYYFETNFTIVDIQTFQPFSALNIIGYKGLETWFIYPLQVLNLFELAYWLLLSYFVGKLAFTEKDKGKPMDLGFKIVASSYGSALLLWVVVVMFFTLNYS